MFIRFFTGHWRSIVTAHEFQMRLQGIDSQTYTHPTIEKLKQYFLLEKKILSYVSYDIVFEIIP
jgi:hypothetical protein